MRTKTLILAAALTAAGLASSLAQSNVYSLNVVGYYNVAVPANTQLMIANQLNTTNNTLGGVIPSVPAGSIFQKFNAGFAAYVFDEFDLSWTPDASVSLAPGEGGFFKSPVATTITFVGEVKQGSLTNTLPINIQVIRGSIVPQAGTPPALGIPGEPGDVLQTYNAGSFLAFVFDEFDLSWTPTEPSITVGQSFFYKKSPTSVTNQWIRNFTVQ